MSNFFFLPHVATLVVVTITTDRSGQATEHYNDAGTFRCLYNPTVLLRGGDRFSDPLIEYREIGLLWTLPSTIITENNRVRDIRNSKDKIIIEKGIFLVDEVKNVTNLKGRTHHKTVKLIGQTQ